MNTDDFFLPCLLCNQRNPAPHVSVLQIASNQKWSVHCGCLLPLQTRLRSHSSYKCSKDTAENTWNNFLTRRFLFIFHFSFFPWKDRVWALYIHTVLITSFKSNEMCGLSQGHSLCNLFLTYARMIDFRLRGFQQVHHKGTTSHRHVLEVIKPEAYTGTGRKCIWFEKNRVIRRSWCVRFALAIALVSISFMLGIVRKTKWTDTWKLIL